MMSRNTVTWLSSTNQKSTEIGNFPFSLPCARCSWRDRPCYIWSCPRPYNRWPLTNVSAILDFLSTFRSSSSSIILFFTVFFWSYSMNVSFLVYLQAILLLNLFLSIGKISCFLRKTLICKISWKKRRKNSRQNCFENLRQNTPSVCFPN